MREIIATNKGNKEASKNLRNRFIVYVSCVWPGFFWCLYQYHTFRLTILILSLKTKAQRIKYIPNVDYILVLAFLLFDDEDILPVCHFKLVQHKPYGIHSNTLSSVRCVWPQTWMDWNVVLPDFVTLKVARLKFVFAMYYRLYNKKRQRVISVSLFIDKRKTIWKRHMFVSILLVNKQFGKGLLTRLNFPFHFLEVKGYKENRSDFWSKHEEN